MYLLRFYFLFVPQRVEVSSPVLVLPCAGYDPFCTLPNLIIKALLAFPSSTCSLVYLSCLQREACCIRPGATSLYISFALLLIYALHFKIGNVSVNILSDTIINFSDWDQL